MKREVNVKIIVDSDSDQWYFVAGDALRDVGLEIYRTPQNVASNGESMARLGNALGHYIYEYTIKEQA